MPPTPPPRPPHVLAANGLDLLQQAAYNYLNDLKTNRPSLPIANGEEIGKALGIHDLDQPTKPASNPGWVTGAILELAIKAGKVKIVPAPSGKTGRFYEAL